MIALRSQIILLVASALVSFVASEPLAPVGSRLFDAVSSLLGGGNSYYGGSCNTPCPPWNCQDDSAMIHGICCGCASIFQSWSYPCPQDIQCPSIYTSPLCTDYQWMRQCCCSGQF